MAFGTKYRAEFTDDLDLDWKIDFQVDPDPGSITTLQVSGNAMGITWFGEDDIMNQNIMGSKIELNFESDADFLSDIFGIGNLTCKVIVYQGSTVFWNGYVLSDGYSEPYDAPSFTVAIRATDGLGLLKDFDFDDIGYTSRQTAAKIIYDILGKVKITTFTEYVNVYEESMVTTVDDSPLDQFTIDPEVFKSATCYDALVEILKIFNSGIRQNQGIFEIVRFDEMMDTTMYGRIFTSATAKTSTTKALTQNIARTGVTSTLYDTRGGSLMIISPSREIRIYQNYGDRESWIKNYTFAGNTFSYSTYWEVENWTREGMTILGIIYTNWYIPTETDGVTIVVRNNYPDLSKYIQQEFAYHAVISDDTFSFQFDYQWLSSKGSTAAGQVLYFSIESSDGTKYMVENDDYWCSWQAGANKMSITEDVLDGFSGWKTWSRRIDGIEVAGPYIVKFYALDDTDLIYIALKNVIFTQATNKTRDVSGFAEWAQFYRRHKSNGFKINFNNTYSYEHPTEYTEFKKITERLYSKTNSLSGPIIGYNHVLGDVTDAGIDNIIEQYKGALATTDFATATADFDTDHSADYSGGGVVVTHFNNIVIMTSAVAGTNFTGPTSITNTTGNLSGTVTTVTPNAAAKGQIDEVDNLSGTAFSSIDITIGAVTKRCTWNTDAATTAAGFLTAGNIAAFAAINITLAGNDSVPSDGFVFTGLAGVANAFTTTVVEFSPTFTWSLDTTQAAADGVARVDHITLTGSSGTANILCDGVTEEVKGYPVPTSDWNTRGGSESRDLLQLICDAWAAQYARQKMCIDLPVRETGQTTFLNLNGNLQDDYNIISGYNRKFAIARAEFAVKSRDWNLTLSELVFTPAELLTISTITVEEAAATNIVITYSDNLDTTHVPALSCYSVSLGTLTGIAVAGAVVTLTVASRYYSSDTITVTYVKPANNALRSSDGGRVASFTDQAVTNNTTTAEGTAPVFVSVTVENAAPTKVILTYDQDLDGASVPATTDFTVTDHTISGVAISGATVELTLSTAVIYFDILYVTYTKGANPIQGDVGELDAADLASTLITNNVAVTGNEVGWWLASDTATITKDGSNFVSAWNCKLGTGRNLLQAVGGAQPLWQTPDAVVGDGVDNFMKTSVFTWNQPEYILLVTKPITNTVGDAYFDGTSYNTGKFSINVLGTWLNLTASTGYNINAGISTGQTYIFRILIDGASSKVIINNTNTYTGTVAVVGMGGLCLYANASPGGYHNCEIKEVIGFTAEPSLDYVTSLYNAVKRRHGL